MKIQFDSMISLGGVNPDERLWSLLITSQTKLGEISSATEILDRLIRIGIKPLPDMYTSILNALVQKNRHDDVDEFWMRMHMDDTDLSKEAFSVMLKACAKTGNAERAFFYMDEMRCLGIAPDVLTFVSLFRACAEAPQWVRGYEGDCNFIRMLLRKQELILCFY